jgi:NAD(P)-dependent dehydrogenase (short-subunit alcohol dehydrogenase family)
MSGSNEELFSLARRRALVTGGSRGIGRSIALALAAHGARVTVQHHGDAGIVNGLLEDLGPGEAWEADFRDPEAVERMAGRASTAAFDILVLGAAIQERRDLGEVDHALFQRHVEANFWSALRLVQAVLPGMRERRWGRILAIGSVQQVRPNPNLLTYAGLKSALSTTMRSLAKAHAHEGVSFNTLAPGLIDTDRTADLKRDPDLYRRIVDGIPAGRAGDPGDCVGAALLLCSPAGRYITGIDLLVDGGMHLP